MQRAPQAHTLHTLCWFVCSFLLAFPSVSAWATQPKKTWEADPCKRCGRRFPKKVKTTQGRWLNLPKHFQHNNRIVIILRTPKCRGCLGQLRRLARIQHRLRACALRFIVLSPGPLNTFQKLARQSPLKALYIPDLKGQIAKPLGLWKNGALKPGILVVDDRQIVVWEYLKRKLPHDGHKLLLDAWRCYKFAHTPTPQAVPPSGHTKTQTPQHTRTTNARPRAPEKGSVANTKSS